MRRIATSLRLRLLFGTLLWIVVSIAATGWLLQQMFSDHLARQFDHELNIHLNQLAASIEFDVAGNLSVQPLSDPRLQQPYSGLDWQIQPPPGPGRPDSSPGVAGSAAVRWRGGRCCCLAR